MKIEFAEDFPGELKSPARRMLKTFGAYLCGAVDLIHVSFVDQESSEARVDVLTRYRAAHVQLAASWATLSEEDREHVICHELAHIPLEPVFKMLGTAFTQLRHDESKAIAQEWFTEALEGATEDVARAVLAAHRRKR
jgi:hypothetical protein